jgi:hypothetical protein
MALFGLAFMLIMLWAVAVFLDRSPWEFRAFNVYVFYLIWPMCRGMGDEFAGAGLASLRRLNTIFEASLKSPIRRSAPRDSRRDRFRISTSATTAGRFLRI